MKAKFLLFLFFTFCGILAEAQTNTIYVNFSCSGTSTPFALPQSGTFNGRPRYSYSQGNKEIDIYYYVDPVWSSENGLFIGYIPDVTNTNISYVYRNTANTSEPPLGLAGWANFFQHKIAH